MSVDQTACHFFYWYGIIYLRGIKVHDLNDWKIEQQSNENSNYK